MKDSVRLGSGSAYWGDVLHPAVEIVERGELDYICFDHLAELTLAVLQRIRSKDPARGYIEDIGPWTEATLRQAREQGIRTITNAGGANPPAAAEVVARVAESFGLGDTRIGVVTGDDIFSRLEELRGQGVKFPNLDTGEEDIDRIADRIVAANAYIGADGMLEALADDAHVVVLGRCSDNALYAGPMMHEFGWDFETTDPNLLGAAVTIGHLLECAALADRRRLELLARRREPLEHRLPDGGRAPRRHRPLHQTSRQRRTDQHLDAQGATRLRGPRPALVPDAGRDRRLHDPALP